MKINLVSERWLNSDPIPIRLFIWYGFTGQKQTRQIPPHNYILFYGFIMGSDDAFYNVADAGRHFLRLFFRINQKALDPSSGRPNGMQL